MAAIVFLVWLQSRFDTTAHLVDNGTHVFKYNWVPWFFFFLMAGVLVAFAEIARRYLKDYFAAIVCWLSIPLFFGSVQLQILYERVEVNDTVLVHRREPPHTEFNVDIPWKSITSASKVEYQGTGPLAPTPNHVGYVLELGDGRQQRLPSNTILTRAQEEIDRQLKAHGIPMFFKRVGPNDGSPPG